MTTRHKPFSHRCRAGTGLGLWLLSAVALADAANPLTGFYYGTAAISQPASLGTVDLAFYLDVTGSTIQQATSYIDLDKTLLFPTVAPQIGGKDVGPRVTGSLSSGAFGLTSLAFPSTVSGKSVTRRILLNTAMVSSGGTAISGKYVETVDGLTPTRMVIQGTFQLRKPVATALASGQDGNGDGCLDLNEIRAGGSDPNVVEFSDVSAAMSLYRSPTAALKVGAPPGPDCANGAGTVQKAVEEFHGSAR